MEFVVLQTDSLREWDKNTEIRDISPENFSRLKLKLQGKPQYEPLFVTPNNDGTFTVIAGNHRLRAYKDLGVTELWVRVIEIRQNPADNTFFRVIDGQEEAENFMTVDDALMDFSLSHNERFAQYELDNLANLDNVFNLNWDNYNIDTTKPMSMTANLRHFGIEPEAATEEPPQTSKNQKLAICPNCSHEFVV